ncbi:hypothetical protein VTN77DRAFT_3117 [Rasamsonia byssochlamydoides]|uniref:uncharacterized protein n=1 Tax=Rasamsonia byssochlamydoides TaxID=89139 RepID=UPI003741F34A
MVLLVITPTILSALETLSPSSRDELQLPHSPAVGSPISHAQVIALARYFTSGSGIKVQKEVETLRDRPAGDDESRDGNTEADLSREKKNDERNDTGSDNSSAAAAPLYTLNSLLRGTRVYVPPPPPKPEPSPEYLALKARLQAAAEEEAYNRLLSPPSSTAPGPSPIFSSPNSHSSLHDDAADNDNDPLTPSLVLNIFMSVLLCGFSTFWALTNFQTPAFLSFATSKPSAGTAAQAVEPAFVLMSIFVGLLVGVAEVVVYAAYLRKVGQARAKEKGIKERKEVIRPAGGEDNEVQGSEEKKKAGTDDGEVEQKEEIWGRGVNGGVRRRVRERWRAADT